MPPLFPRRANDITRRTLYGVAAVGIVALAALMGWVRTPVAMGQDRDVEQPIPFDHRIHVTGFGIDCRYCHSAAERAPRAGIPATDVCVSCHEPLWLQSSVFAPVRQSLATERPIPWRRVHRLPDFVYFDHSAHVTRGVGCESCHGRVDRMKRVTQVAPLDMGWCVGCHRQPEAALRPVSEVATMGWTPPEPQARMGRELARRYGVRSLTTCSTCHR